MTPPHRCGAVAIIGRPNVGKSTLLNRLVGQKLASVSPKPETTRDRLLAIVTRPDAQILLTDTPGIYKGPKTLMGKHQVQVAREALAEADALLALIDGTAGFTDDDRDLLRLLPRRREDGRPVKPVFLAINKVDKASKPLLLPQIEEALRLYPFTEVFPISAMNGENVHELVNALIAALPEGPPHFPPDQVTDKPVRLLAQDLIREKALMFTHEEVPHAVAVLIDEWRDGTRGKKLYVRATLYVERDTQKAILVGKGGGVLKKIGEASRKELEKLVERPVFLDLWVKLAKNWRKDPVMLRRLGF